MTNCLSCVTNPFFSIFSTKKVIRFTSRYRCASLFLHWVAAGSSHNKPALCSSVLEQDTAALTSRCSFWLLTLTARWREGAPCQDNSRISPSGDRYRKRRSNNQLSCLCCLHRPKRSPLRGPRHSESHPKSPDKDWRDVWSSHAHPHTPGLGALWCSVAITCNHRRRRPNFHLSIYQTWRRLCCRRRKFAFLYEDPTCRGFSQQRENHTLVLADLSPPTEPHANPGACFLPALSSSGVPPGCPLPPSPFSLCQTLASPTAVSTHKALLKHLRVSCCCKSGMQTQNTGERWHESSGVQWRMSGQIKKKRNPSGGELHERRKKGVLNMGRRWGGLEWMKEPCEQKNKGV